MAAVTTKTLYEKVVEKLENFPHLRDSDEKLVSNIWVNELGGTEAVSSLTAMQFLGTYAAAAKLTSASAIERARRKVQENRSDLRGTIYYSRKHKVEEQKEILRNLTK